MPTKETSRENLKKAQAARLAKVQKQKSAVERKIEEQLAASDSETSDSEDEIIITRGRRARPKPETKPDAMNKLLEKLEKLEAKLEKLSTPVEPKQPAKQPDIHVHLNTGQPKKEKKPVSDELKKIVCNF